MAEARLWSWLRNRRLAGYKFKRQYPVGPFIVDFACLDLKLIIEADGSQHADQKAYDGQRTAWLEGKGWQVLRFWNDDILANTEGVMERVLEAIRHLETNPSPSKPDQ